MVTPTGDGDVPILAMVKSTGDDDVPGDGYALWRQLRPRQW